MRRALVAGVIAAAAVAGCGGGPPDAHEIGISAGETRTDGERGGYALEGGEIRSDPGPAIRVKVGEPVTITFDNVHGTFFGESIDHDFAIVADKDNFVPLLPDALWGAQTKVIYPDDSPDVVTFTPDKPGTHYYICSVPGHVERGMWGRFIVEK